VNAEISGDLSGSQVSMPERNGDTMEKKRPERLRSDARSNRERLLAVALEELTASSDASLNSIAKKAGVGPGTLYRHFPNREALVLEVYRYEVHQLVDAAPVLLRTQPPLHALREWLNRLAHYGMTKAGLAEALSNAATSRDGLAAETYGPVIGALSMLLQANEQAGTIRSGLHPDDVLLLLGFLWRIDPTTDWHAQATRLLDIVIDGLRATAPGPTSGVHH
jgi:AcrR family transcriptional regulator